MWSEAVLATTEMKGHTLPLDRKGRQKTEDRMGREEHVNRRIGRQEILQVELIPVLAHLGSYASKASGGF